MDDISNPALGKVWMTAGAHTRGWRELSGVFKISKQIDQPDLVDYPRFSSRDGLAKQSERKQKLHQQPFVASPLTKKTPESKHT